MHINKLLTNKIFTADNLQLLKSFPDNCIDLIVTSPNYNNWRNRRTQANRKEYWARTNILYDNCNDKESDESYETKQKAVHDYMTEIIMASQVIYHGIVKNNRKLLKIAFNGPNLDVPAGPSLYPLLEPAYVDTNF